MQCLIKGDSLILSAANCSYHTQQTPTYKIRLPSLNHINLAGSGSIFIEKLEQDKFSCEISGSGNVRVVSGGLNSAVVNIIGSGSFSSQAVAQTAQTSISGSGNVELPVQHDLQVTIMGSGSCFYQGDPHINTQIGGSGRLYKV